MYLKNRNLLNELYKTGKEETSFHYIINYFRYYLNVC